MITCKTTTNVFYSNIHLQLVGGGITFAYAQIMQAKCKSSMPIFMILIQIIFPSRVITTTLPDVLDVHVKTLLLIFRSPVNH